MTDDILKFRAYDDEEMDEEGGDSDDGDDEWEDGDPEGD